VVLGIKGWADASLASHADVYEEIGMGQLGLLIERLKSHGVREAIMAGKVTKEVLFDQRAGFDAQTLGLLRQVSDYSVGTLLGAVAKQLAGCGVTLLDSSIFLKASLCPEGVLTKRAPNEGESADIRLGQQVAKAMAALDVGQTVIVKERVVVAVEALEGTDAAIRRAHSLAGGGLVVVKAASPNQDRRFDLPIIGADTIATLAKACVSCLALEAHVSLLLERDTLIARANDAGICIIGVLPIATTAP
jgi:DUF1009 family protein